MRHILSDIMGTTTPVDYPEKLHDAFRKGGDHLENAGKEIKDRIQRIKEKSGAESTQGVIEYIIKEIEVRNMDPDYLQITGFVNTQQYRSGELVGEFYSDVPVAFENWEKNDKGIYVYSNGSEESQRLMFTHSNAGNIAKYVNRFFDTDNVGSKHEADSYRKICDMIGSDPKVILFISDREKELEAADKAGLEVNLIVREPGIITESRYNQIRDFYEVNVE